MASEESAELRQNNELEVLKAIYGEDLKDLRGKAAWNKWTPLNLSISLNPQQGSSGCHEIYVYVDLCIICDEIYPNSVPKIKLEHSKGLSDNSLKELQNKLEKNAEELKGEEMIFQLAQYVQEFLHGHNKPAPKSFYDEMMQRQREQEEKELQAQQMEDYRRKQIMQQEFQRRQEMLKLESRRRREQRYNSETSNEYDSDTRRQSISNNSFEISDESLCEHKETVIVNFGNRQIRIGQCLRHCSYHVVFIGMDVKTGEIVLLTEWTLKNSKQLCSLEQEFNQVTRFSHPNLAHYLNFKCDQQSDKTVLYVLKDVSIEFVRYVAKGVLTALDYLHRNNVVHKDIRESCVYINDKGAILLSNYSFHRRLIDISSQTSNPPNCNKKTDIYKFGVFLLGLLRGTAVTGADNIDIPTSLPDDLYDFMTRCVAAQEKGRLTAAQLLKHQFLCEIATLSSPRHQIDVNIPDRNFSPELTPSGLAELRQSGQSRMDNEFELIISIGKGAFGDVVKARNKLDGRCYAVKRIKLNPKNKHLNKKIVREVKLLSSLNHENIVRYYNSWIEETTIVKEEDSDAESGTPVRKEKGPVVKRLGEFTVNDRIEDFALSAKSIVTCVSKSTASFNADSDEESGEEISWGVFKEDSDSDGIEFERDSIADTEDNQESSQTSRPADRKDDTLQDDNQVENVLYIQMELCEKNTLRNAIDAGVYKDKQRVLRLFREIIEGLAHIHQQGMIHRDLKPVNIFLDSRDRVKIGDFGLATNTKTKRYELTTPSQSHREDAMDESKTGLIGTALYVAPEVSTGSKVNYNEKVDIYSLGIIFFEMCYRPLPTAMERITILTGLRKKEIEVPEDFTDPSDRVLVDWLLNHDSSKRPTSHQLLQSEHLPSLMVEEGKFRALVKRTLSDPQLKGYKYIIASCFDQKLNLPEDITYDKDPSGPTLNKPQVYDFAKQIIIKIFKQHGGQNLSTPLLMPKSHYYEGVESCVKLMTHFGGIVSLPHDLRVPFARYVAWNGISLLRRYSIERVYREKKVFGFLPRELYECAFDIVTPAGTSRLPDVEILYIVYEIINELPGLKNKQVTIRLNHTNLMSAILTNSGIKERHQEVLQKFSDFKDGNMSRNDLKTYLISFGLSDNSITTLTDTLSLEFKLSKIPSQLHSITRKKTTEANQLAKALQELKAITHNAEAFGISFDMVIAPGVVYNIRQYSGMICQFVCDLKKKHRHGNKEVLAAGGRYDSMIASYRKIVQEANPLSKEVPTQSAVGISLSLDKLVQAMMREKPDDLAKMEFLDVAVCTLGSKPLIKEKTKILVDLWASGIRCALIEATNIEEVQEQCAELKVTHVVLLKDGEHAMVRVCGGERERFQERTFMMCELVENVQRIVKSAKEGAQEAVSTAAALSKSDSRTNWCNEQSHEVDVTVLFLMDKSSAISKRRSEVTVRSHLSGLFKKLNGEVSVVVLSLEPVVISTIAAHLSWESEKQYEASVRVIAEKLQRHRRDLNYVCDKIYEVKCKNNDPTVVLYNVQAQFHKLLI